MNTVTTRNEWDRLGELIVGFRGAQVLFTAATLNLFDIVDGGHTREEISANAGTNLRATELLLDALCALDFLQKTGGYYDNTPFGRQVFLPSREHSILHNLKYQDALSRNWAKLTQVVRASHPARTLKTMIKEDPQFVEVYIRGMDEIARGPARELASALDLRGADLLLDVGGGPGTYTRALLKRAPRLHAVLLDLPETLRLTQEFFAECPDRHRVQLRPCDYQRDPFGRHGADLVLLSHVTHDESAAENRGLFAKAFDALTPGGRIVVHDFMTAGDRTSPLFSVLFSIHMLVYTTQGRAYGTADYEAWLSEAGFTDFTWLTIASHAPNSSRALIAVKPGGS